MIWRGHAGGPQRRACLETGDLNRAGYACDCKVKAISAVIWRGRKHGHTGQDPAEATSITELQHAHNTLPKQATQKISPSPTSILLIDKKIG
jgi:hypothetical protein